MNRYYTLIGIYTLIDIYSYLLNAMSAYANANIFTQTYKNSHISFSSFPFLPAEIPAFILQFSSVAQSCPTLCDPINCSTPGLPVHHQLPELTQTHVHRVSDAIQPSASNPSQHQSLFQ